jgi:L-threonylcarbamoyladenylate synthase
MVQRFDNDDLHQALEVLKQGGTILYPTDTVWGIGCDATNADAVDKIISLKKRNLSKGMIVLTDLAGRIPQYLHAMPELAWDLIEMATKPLTIIYPGAKNLPPNVTGSEGTIGIRVTDELFSKTLCSRFRKPIVSTSANVSGKPCPLFFNQISAEIVSGVDYVVRFRQDETKSCRPSGIVSLGLHGEIKIIME